MRTITTDELATILKKHKLWLDGAESGERANLSSADLSSANLRSANLSSANLSSADLRSADLRSADLSSADLRSANLSLANLSSANLRSADLSSANLRSANLSLANLSSANLRSADLRSADLSSADLRSANLSLANLSLADLTFVRDDLWAVLSASPAEVPGLRLAIAEGRIDGTCYQGECCCLVGTLAKLRGAEDECGIPGLVPSAGRAAESWFTAIRPGMMPESANHVSLTLAWVDDWLARVRSAIPALSLAVPTEGGAA